MKQCFFEGHFVKQCFERTFYQGMILGVYFLSKHFVRECFLRGCLLGTFCWKIFCERRFVGVLFFERKFCVRLFRASGHFVRGRSSS